MSPESSRFGRSICVLSPVITAFEFTPRRVRNIFICAVGGVLRFVEDHERVRRASARACTRAARSRSYATRALSAPARPASCRRAHRRAGADTDRPSPACRPAGSRGSRRLRRRDARARCAARACAPAHRPPRDGEVGLTRARRPDADDDVVLRDQLHVLGLPRRLGLDDAPHAPGVRGASRPACRRCRSSRPDPRSVAARRPA